MYFFHTTSICGPLGSFLCIVYWGPQITFFAYYMGALRSVSSIQYGGPSQITFIVYYMGPPPPQISFFACYRGPPQILVFSQNIVYGGPLRSVSPLIKWDPLMFVSLLTYGAPSDQFLCLLFWGLLRSVFSLTIWGPLRSVSSPTI